MGNVGLLFVGAVLFVNGVMLLGWIEAKSAAPMNLLVGGLQVITPTYLIFTADGNTEQILGASGLYLFGFTYLYVAFNMLAGLDGTALGYFFGFVAVCARGVLRSQLLVRRRTPGTTRSASSGSTGPSSGPFSSSCSGCKQGLDRALHRRGRAPSRAG